MEQDLNGNLGCVSRQKSKELVTEFKVGTTCPDSAMKEYYTAFSSSFKIVNMEHGHRNTTK